MFPATVFHIVSVFTPNSAVIGPVLLTILLSNSIRSRKQKTTVLVFPWLSYLYTTLGCGSLWSRYEIAGAVAAVLPTPNSRLATGKSTYWIEFWSASSSHNSINMLPTGELVTHLPPSEWVAWHLARIQHVVSGAFATILLLVRQRWHNRMNHRHQERPTPGKTDVMAF